MIKLQERYGGAIALKESKKYKNSWTWSAYSETAKNFLIQIQPYCIIKKSQVDVAVLFPLVGQGKITTDSKIRETQKAIKDFLAKEKRINFTSQPIQTARDLESNPKVQESVRLYVEDLKSVAEIAIEIGDKPSTVGYWLRCMGVTRDKGLAVSMGLGKRRDGIHNPQVEEVKKLYTSGVSISEIARRLDRKPATVNYWLRQLGQTRNLKEAQRLRRLREKAV